MKTSYFTADWSEKDQQDFFQALKKSRGQKLHHIYAKASALYRGKKIEEAIRLLEIFICDYLDNKEAILSKNKYPQVYKGDIERFCVIQGDYCLTLDDNNRAAEKYEKARDIHYAPDAWPLHPEQVSTGLTKLFSMSLAQNEIEEAGSWLQEIEQRHPDMKAWDLARLHLQLAYKTGDFTRSDALFNAYYETLKGHSEYRSYEQLEGQDHYDLGIRKIENDPWHAAETIVTYHHVDIPEIYNYDEKALSVLDFALRNKVEGYEEQYDLLSYKLSFLWEQIIPELGAYLGECIIRTLGGKWEKGAKLMQSRVILGDKKFNPFLVSYNAYYLGHRLLEEGLQRAKASL